MPTAIHLHLTSKTPQPGWRFAGRSIIDGLNTGAAREFGGTCVGTVTDFAIVAEIRGGDLSRVQSLIDRCVDSLLRKTADLQVVINEAAPALTSQALHQAQSLTSQRVKLTRSLYDSLPAGAFVASNVWSRQHKSVFAAAIVDGAGREAQWQEIRRTGAAQRTCDVFLNEGLHRVWLQDLTEYFTAKKPSPPEPPGPPLGRA